jgi:hypothetical protein
MKKILAASAFALSLSLLVSCQSNTVNDYKIKIADKVSSSAFEKLNSEAVEKNISFEGYSCESEFQRYADDLKKFTLKTLKAREDSPIASKSLVQPALRSLCLYVADLAQNALPSVLPNNRCLVALGYTSASPLIQSACQKI